MPAPLVFETDDNDILNLEAVNVSHTTITLKAVWHTQKCESAARGTAVLVCNSWEAVEVLKVMNRT